MIIKNGRLHDGKGNVNERDIRILDGIIDEIGNGLEAKEGEEVVDAYGLEVLPGFVHAMTNWGINGSMTEIKPSSEDNDEISSPVTPELDVRYAFNGRAASNQKLGGFGITSVGITPTDNNLFGGQIAVFETDGVNPYKMCIKPQAGMKASLTGAVKRTYGTRQMAPMSKMWQFAEFKSWLKRAAEDTAGTDPKLAALKKVITGEMPLFLSVDNVYDLQCALDILKNYEKVRTVVCNGYGLSGEEDWLIDGKTSLIMRFPFSTVEGEELPMNREGIAKLYEKGLPVSIGGMPAIMAREDMLWTAIEMMKVIKDEEKVLKMMTKNPAEALGIGGLTGTLEAGKRADIVLWSGNPLTTWQARVVRTWQAGRVIYREGERLSCI